MVSGYQLEHKRGPKPQSKWHERRSEPDWGLDRSLRPQPPLFSEPALPLYVALWRDLDRDGLREAIRESFRGRQAQVDLKTLTEILRLLREHREQERIMVRLEDAADAKDERAFLDVLREAKWQDRPAADFKRAARLALKAGAYSAAFRISFEGAKHHPGDSDLEKHVRVLAPPKAFSRKIMSNTAHKANRAWLEKHGSTYNGRWVAIRDGKLLGDADSLRS